MQLTLIDNLPFITVEVIYQGVRLEVPQVLVDTGSATTLLSVDILNQIGILPEPEDTLHTIRGVGGVEVVFTRFLDRLQVGDRGLDQFEIEIGGMDYGFEINGILGMDFLLNTGAVINLRELRIY